MATTSCEAFSCRIDGTFDLIEDEKFDFDVPISPMECESRETSNGLEDEDEVFFGPIGHKERCVTANSGLKDEESFKPLSPLNGEQIAQLFKEATAVSIFLKSSSSHQSIDDVEDEICNKENSDICNILSQTFNVTGDENSLSSKPDLIKESDLKITESASSPESVSEENISTQAEYSDGIIPATPKRVLQERNSEDPTFMPLPSPFKGRKARPRQNVSKFTNSKLPKTNMTLKTRSCFNSPIKVEHAYGVTKSKPAEEKADQASYDGTSSVKPPGIMRTNNLQGSSKGDSSFTESSSKLPVPSLSGIRPPGFGAQSQRRRTNSTSSTSSTSSAVSDLNNTFTVSKDSSFDNSSLPSVSSRRMPATKACLRSVNATSGVPKPMFSKPQGRPQPVKALPQTGVSGRKAPPTPKSLGSTPGRSKSSLTSKQERDRSQTPSSVKRSKSFTTSNTDKNRSSISTGQPIKGSLTPSKTRKSEVMVTPRRRGSITGTPTNNPITVPTPLKRRGGAVEGDVPQIQTKVKGHRPSTPANSICVSSSTVTPPNPVPSKVTKRKSLSANGPQQRSFLPTPLRSDRITRSRSIKSRPASSTAGAPLPFNISPSAELYKPRRPAASDLVQARSRLSDPFSPASQITTVDPAVQDSTGGDGLVRNLIEWSPALPKEGTLIDI